jgi:hypothetical protein
VNTKPFFASKLNWLGIITFFAGLGAFADKVPASWVPYITAAAGIATVLLRTFGTSTAISGVTK